MIHTTVSREYPPAVFERLNHVVLVLYIFGGFPFWKIFTIISKELPWVVCIDLMYKCSMCPASPLGIRH